MAQDVHQHTFSNGLTLLAERMAHVRSAALNFLVPAGGAYDPPEQLGIAAILSEMITRGAGDRDSRETSLSWSSRSPKTSARGAQDWTHAGLMSPSRSVRPSALA